MSDDVQMSTVENNLVKDHMKELLTAAMKHGCSQEGHNALVQLMEINGTLMIDTRDSVKATHKKVTDMSETITKIYDGSRSTALFFGKKWANPVKLSAILTGVLAFLCELYQFFVGLVTSHPKVGP